CVERVLAIEEWTFMYWLWGGAVGLGTYALARKHEHAVARACVHLERLATRTRHGVAWWNREDLELAASPVLDPRGYHNLGIPLGIGGVVAFLAEAIAAGFAPASARPLLADAVAFLLSHDDPTSSPRFPMCAGFEVPPDKLRNSWCYGDAAIAAAVARAGAATGSSDWSSRA